MTSTIADTANLPPSEEPACSCQCIAEDQSSETESEDDTGVANAFDEFIAQNNLCKFYIFCLILLSFCFIFL